VGTDDLCKLGKEYLTALRYKLGVSYFHSRQNSETFDILHAFLSLVAAKLSDLKNSPVFLAHSLQTREQRAGKSITNMPQWRHHMTICSLVFSVSSFKKQVKYSIISQGTLSTGHTHTTLLIGY